MRKNIDPQKLNVNLSRMLRCLVCEVASDNNEEVGVMSWLGGDDSTGGVRVFGGGSDYPWWEEQPPINRTIRCQGGHIPEYQAVTAVICAMFLVFGVVYCLFGYRCFKAVMFLTGFLFASVVVYLICLSEALLPLIGNAGVALGAGVLFGLITMLVQYVGLFMTGFHTGLFLGVALVAAVYPWAPPSVWAVVGMLLSSGLLMAVLTLYFQKGLTIIGTAVSGGAIMAATLDYFVEELLMVEWFRDRLMSAVSEPPCWFSWLLVAVWPFMVIVGSITQWRISGKGIYHQQMVPSVKSRNVSLHRLRSREARAELRQKKYRYLYQVRTAHGDIISQEYIQSLQRKAYPACDNGTLQSDSTHTTMLPSDQTQLAPLTESEDEGGVTSSGGFYPQEEESEPIATAGVSRSSAASVCQSRSAHPRSQSPPPTTSGLQQRDYRFGSPNLHPTPPPSPASPEPSINFREP
ncbi:Transmembrane protein [Armadillidium nasatum]|uniref:Transmembrane protein 198 n=1 Tax=Armadillidium nasatum TaxID=96803 RepID=A0A5N5TGF1_9CRUS|nr:Transmembrane protein [Armadillidium nasatum]